MRVRRLFTTATTAIGAAALLAMAPLQRAGNADSTPDETLVIFDEAPLQVDPQLIDGSAVGPYAAFDGGRTLQTSLELPPKPADQRDARRIVATIIVEPVHMDVGDGQKVRAADPWTRAGNLCLVRPAPSRAAAATRPTTQPEPTLIELVRFITPFGGQATYVQDLTPLAPLLSGKVTFRLHLSTQTKPGWKATVTLRYTAAAVGIRRPIWAEHVFHSDLITAENNRLRSAVEIPRGVAQPRIRIISTGHATDGAGGDEFVTRAHVLRVDGQEVARWRPWAESGGALREVNPFSGRRTVDGRTIWSSDSDRSGWHPGLAVEPINIPLPELTPGKHTIELEIVGIRPKDVKGMGYWRASAILVADEPWPNEPGSRE